MVDRDRARLDPLFGAPLGEFVAERDALAKALRAEGNEAAAGRVKALKKPPVSAWVVNQLALHHGGLVRRLLDAGQQMRRAHLALLAGEGSSDAFRRSIEAQHAALAELQRAAEAALAAAGLARAPATLRRVSTSLRAAAVNERLGEALAAGRLTADLEPDSLEALVPVAPARAEPTARPAPKATAARAEARRRVTRARALLSKAEARAEELEVAAAAARREAERAEARAEQARSVARSRRAAVEAATARLRST